MRLKLRVFGDPNRSLVIRDLGADPIVREEVNAVCLVAHYLLLEGNKGLVHGVLSVEELLGGRAGIQGPLRLGALIIGMATVEVIKAGCM